MRNLNDTLFSLYKWSRKRDEVLLLLSWCFHVYINHTAYGGGTEVGEEGDDSYLSLHCHHQNDSCIKMGSDESQVQ